MDDLRHKHWAVIIVGILLALLIAITAWYVLWHDTAIAPVTEVASTTPVTTVEFTDVPAHIIEEEQYFDIDLTYPSVTPLSGGANTDAVAVMKAEMTSIARDFKTQQNFDNLTADDIEMMGLGNRKMALGSEYEMYQGDHTVSYVFQIYEDTFGAHPNLYYRTFAFNIDTGARLQLGDLFTSGSDYLTVLSERARASVPSIINKKGNGIQSDPTFVIDGTSPAIENFQWFYIDGDTFVSVFPPYQVGPWALGTVEMPVPLSEFSSILRATYKPLK